MELCRKNKRKNISSLPVFEEDFEGKKEERKLPSYLFINEINK